MNFCTDKRNFGFALCWRSGFVLAAVLLASFPPHAIAKPVAALHQVEPPTKPTYAVQAVKMRCDSQEYVYPPKEQICEGKACPKLAKDAPSLPTPTSHKCERRDRKALVSIILLRPQNGSLVDLVRSKVPVAWGPEVLGFEDGDQQNKDASNKHKSVISHMRSHFMVYSNHKMGDLRPLNRLVKLANAEMVLVVPKGSAVSTLSSEWVHSAAAALMQHESLAVVGMQGAEGSAGQGEMEFVHAVALDHPLVIRRSAFLSVGLVDTSGGCPSEGRLKENEMWVKFCKTLWRQGLSVAALDWEANISAASKVAIPAALKSLWPGKALACPEKTDEYHRGRQDCSHGPDNPPASVIVQYFKREKNIQRLGKELRSLVGVAGADLMINDDSQSEHGQWLEALKGAPNVWLVHSPNIHEIRGYNRLGKMANAELVAMMQDDDHARELDWLERAMELFANHPNMALLGGRAGRLDTGKEMEVKGERKSIPGYTPGPLWQNDGPKFGWKYTKLKHMDAKSGQPFEFVYKVNASPLVVRRKVFLESGMYHPGMSCVGESGISFDFEYSVRMWKHGHKVGLYYSHFDDFLNSRSSGTWASAMATRKRLVTWRRNNMMLYYMYPGFHHAEGTSLPVRASEDRSAVLPISCSGKAMVKSRCPLSRSGMSR
mmetsp:Transcript_9390/g.17610  ORF Transcript_9390/g.17610 Transcript_9390/m.17610 type:complete len:659 (+) Transcript_9390:88-2064(+)|eukprot:CAMPEP_0114242288 /NCGR_PEP_ID=MMETSP0058-20121206/10085_1 /TAXON_ID=36894 /ORGANISM="Pyramimonas parkeae, CCMP726" /LENGTH=658 /DNA_ID=CAMNT_0001354869 /DNA_START=34 /DNA_END=2010 /DNA_ORIENTATION=+